MTVFSDEQKASILAQAEKNYERYLHNSARAAKNYHFTSILQSMSIDEDLEESTNLIIQHISNLISESDLKEDMSDISDITNSLEEESLEEESLEEESLEEESLKGVIKEYFERAFIRTPPPSPILLANNPKYLTKQLEEYLSHLKESLNDADEQLCIGWRESNYEIDSHQNNEEDSDDESLQFTFG